MRNNIFDSRVFRSILRSLNHLLKVSTSLQVLLYLGDFSGFVIAISQAQAHARVSTTTKWPIFYMNCTVDLKRWGLAAMLLARKSPQQTDNQKKETAGKYCSLPSPREYWLSARNGTRKAQANTRPVIDSNYTHIDLADGFATSHHTVHISNGAGIKITFYFARGKWLSRKTITERCCYCDVRVVPLAIHVSETTVLEALWYAAKVTGPLLNCFKIYSICT